MDNPSAAHAATPRLVVTGWLLTGVLPGGRTMLCATGDDAKKPVEESYDPNKTSCNDTYWHVPKLEWKPGPAGEGERLWVRDEPTRIRVREITYEIVAVPDAAAAG